MKKKNRIILYIFSKEIAYMDYSTLLLILLLEFKYLYKYISIYKVGIYKRLGYLYLNNIFITLL